MSAPSGPRFIGVGMERSGTSWLFALLAAHPEIWVPPLKELHYFDSIDPEIERTDPRYRNHLKARLRQKAAWFRRFENRPELYKMPPLRSLRWDLRYFRGARGGDWYRGLFDPVFTGGRIAGEITPAYAALSARVIADKNRAFPDARILLMLRHPYERLRSGLIHYLRVERRLDPAAAGEERMLEWLGRGDVRTRSASADILATWRGLIPPERLFVGVLEQASEDPGAFMERVYGFLGADPAFRPPESLSGRKINRYSRGSDSLGGAVEQAIRDRAGREIGKMRDLAPEIAAFWERS